MNNIQMISFYKIKSIKFVFMYDMNILGISNCVVYEEQIKEVEYRKR